MVDDVGDALDKKGYGGLVVLDVSTYIAASETKEAENVQ